MAQSDDLSHCRICGDQSATDPDTWKATGLCEACNTPAVLAGSIRRKRKLWDDYRCAPESRQSIAAQKIRDNC